jgi:hypothetical protein
MASRKRPVEVVVCGDPWANKPFTPKKPRHGDEVNEDGHFRPHKKFGGPGEFDMSDASKSVRDLGSTQFAAWQRKQYEQSKVEDLGGRKAKSIKMPLPMLQGIRAKRDKIKGLRDTEAKAAGIVVAKARDTGGKGRRKDREDGGLGETIVKGGVLTVARKMLEGKTYTMPKGKSGKGKGGGKGGKGGKGKGKGKGGGGKGKSRH